MRMLTEVSRRPAKGASLRTITLILLTLLLGTTVWADDKTKDKDSEAIAILKVAMAKQKESGALDKAIADLDALVAKQPKDPDTHYARGWVLSRLGRAEPAVAAYDKAFELDKKFADAAYNAGVVLAKAGKTKDAVTRFDRALAANPAHIDAAYNAGQSYYDMKDFAKAAERWLIARKLAPQDFNAAKKVLQAYNALGNEAEAVKARDRVLELKKTSKDPQVMRLKSFVFDQFAVGKYHIFVSEAFDTSGTLAYVYQFQVTEKDTPLGSVNLETSAVIREQGTPFILGMDKGDKHTSFPDKTWKTMPTYKVVKAEAIKKIEASF